MIPQRCAAKTSKDYNRIREKGFDGRCHRYATHSIHSGLYCREHASLIALDIAIRNRVAAELAGVKEGIKEMKILKKADAIRLRSPKESEHG